jgi:hypothetical protein
MRHEMVPPVRSFLLHIVYGWIFLSCFLDRAIAFKKILARQTAFVKLNTIIKAR